MSETIPTYLLLLRQLRYAVGQPTLRQLSETTGLAHSTIGNILNGGLPEQERIELLLDAFNADRDQRKAVLQAVEDEIVLRRYRRTAGTAADAPTRNPDLDSRSETVLLADAIGDLAQAITDLAAALHADRVDRSRSDHH